MCLTITYVWSDEKLTVTNQNHMSSVLTEWNSLSNEIKKKKKESGLHPFDENTFYLIMKIIVNTVRTVERNFFLERLELSISFEVFNQNFYYFFI